MCIFGMNIFRRIEKFCFQRMHACQEQLQAHQRAMMIRIAQNHNMSTHADENYYCRQYWHWIEKALEDFVKEKVDTGDLLILDLGCGQGRLTLPLAKWCSRRREKGRVIGVDIAASALDFARQSAAKEGVNYVVEYLEDDILNFLRNQPTATCEVVVCAEVLYMFPEYKTVLSEVNRVLVQGGLFIASFRSRYFNIIHSLAIRRCSPIPILLQSTEGFPFGPLTRFSWHNKSEINGTLAEAGFKTISCKGIGVCSGIKGDPLAKIAQPSMLTDEEQNELMTAELTLAEEMADCGRYILVEAIKMNSTDVHSV